VDDRLELVGARLLDDLANGVRMVVLGSLVERPLVRRQVDAGAPVLQPDVVARVDQLVDERSLDRRAEDVRADARAGRDRVRAQPRRGR
jgi:hypothetical protein